MKLTVALGLQYDSNNRAQTHPAALSLKGSLVTPSAEVEAVMEVPAPVTAAQEFEFSYRHSVYFLTYTLQGLPAPIAVNPNSVDMFA